MLSISEFDSPLGPLAVAECQERVLAIHFGSSAGHAETELLARHPELGERPCRTSAPLGPAGRLLRDYLESRREDLHLKVDLSLVKSEFDRLVLRTLFRTRMGQTLSYGELAQRIGRPNAARAVGGAMRRNPIPILVPCHRVVTSTGALGHYTGGVEKKAWLLEREGARSVVRAA